LKKEEIIEFTGPSKTGECRLKGKWIHGSMKPMEADIEDIALVWFDKLIYPS